MMSVEPFGYFKAEPFGWTDCAETDEGAMALYDQAAVDKLERERDELKATIIEAREALQFANDTPNGPISDTIWMMHRPETLFDFLDAALAKGEKK